LTEQELISQLQQGEEHAFKLLVSRYQDKVFNTAVGLLQQHGDAEDITQEVFIQVYRSVQQFKGSAALSTWIYRITVTKCLDHIRSKKRKKRFGFIVSIFGNDNQPLHEPADFYHPGVALDKKQDAALLFTLIDELPENQKTAFVLNKLEDLSYAEIALVMKTTESAVDSLLQRARQNLKKAVAAKINNTSQQRFLKHSSSNDIIE
jgi:RNA polymerase sigma-70 factor (ECF subfamily)